MSVFSNKLRAFLGNNWDNQLDINLNNQLIAQRNAMLTDEPAAQEFISDFIQKNLVLMQDCSSDFFERINELVSYVTESLQHMNEQEYHGVWEDTSLAIKDKYDRKLDPETVKKLKRMGLDFFSVRIRADYEEPKTVLIIPKVKISKISQVEREVKKIDKDLVVKVTTLPDKDFNIAAKVNKQNAMLNKKKEQDMEMEYNNHLNKSNTVHNNSRNNYVMTDDIMEAKKNDLLFTITERLDKEGLTYDRSALYEFIGYNYDKLYKICEGDSVIDTHRIYALMESHDLGIDDLKENTTADISVPSLPLTGSSLIRKRLAGFDPYGKNVANTSGKNSKTTIKFDADVLMENLGRIDIDRSTVLFTDLNEDNKFSKVLMESENKRMELLLERARLINFVKENADVDVYVNDGVFDFNGYLGSRTKAFVGVLLKEYFKGLLKESGVINDSDGPVNRTNVEDISIKDGQFVISYYYAGDENARYMTVPMSEVEDYVKRVYTDIEDYMIRQNGDQSSSFDFLQFFDDLSFPQRKNLIEEFIDGNVMHESASFDDYNEWKSEVATVTGNNYEIKRKSNDNLLTQALNASGGVVGEWNPTEVMGKLFV